MLTTYRRHLQTCDHRAKGRKYRHCKCPVWADGFLAGRELRKALGTRNWQKAQDVIREWEAEGKEKDLTQRSSDIDIVFACEAYIADAVAEGLQDRTVYKYRLLFRHLQNYSTERGLRCLRELDLHELSTFRAMWKDGTNSSIKKLERLRAFFRFCLRRKWVAENPTMDMKSPVPDVRETLPFSAEEMTAILAAGARKIDKASPAGRANAQRLRVLLLLLRYSGLRIGDAVSCSTDRLQNNALRLYTKKTGQHVHIPLPEFVVRELAVVPMMSERRWFWTGKGKLQTAVADWQGRVAELFVDAGIHDGHFHRLRDTFASALLQSGVSMENVSILLGHSSIKVTEKFYSSWVIERQRQAERDVMLSWGSDPIVLLEGKGTPRVHTAVAVVN
jgi:integrase/recombinase XerD